MLTTGPEQKLTTADLDALLEQQRAHRRVDHRTRVQVISLRADQADTRPDVRTGWTEDVSSTGAKLLICGPLAADTFWIRIPESNRRNEFIECRVKWRDESGLRLSNENCRCGVEFQRVLSREEFDEVLASGALDRETSDQPSSPEETAS